MNLLAHYTLGSALLLGTVAAALAQAGPPTTAKPAPEKKAAPVHASQPNPEERAFQANCSRCHYAPESLSPRITGTVVRHMRVRANLSAEDERLILSYLNP
jgi:cytochrome c5